MYGAADLIIRPDRRRIGGYYVSVNQTFYPFRHDRMFCDVLAHDPSLAKEMLELLLDVKIGQITCVNAQKVLNYSTETKSVRFDVHLLDDKGIRYVLEMEASGSGVTLRWLPRRSRLYGGILDAETVPRGTKYGDVREAYIIFICLHDPFPPFGLARYTCRTTCMENRAVPVDDGMTHLYFNCSAITKNVSDSVQELLDYIAGRTDGETELTRKIQKEVTKRNNDPDWREWVMTFEEKLLINGEEKKAEGKAEGKAGEQERIIQSMFQKGFSDSVIAAVVGELTEKQIAEMRKGMSRPFVRVSED